MHRVVCINIIKVSIFFKQIQTGFKAQINQKNFKHLLNVNFIKKKRIIYQNNFLILQIKEM